MALRGFLEASQQQWSSQDVANAEVKLSQIGVVDIATLTDALGGKLNERLREAGLKTFTAETVRAFRQCLDVKPRSRKAHGEMTEADAAGGGASARVVPPPDIAASGEALAEATRGGHKSFSLEESAESEKQEERASDPPDGDDIFERAQQEVVEAADVPSAEHGELAGDPPDDGATKRAGQAVGEEAPTVEPDARADAPPGVDVSELASVQVVDVVNAPAAEHNERLHGPPDDLSELVPLPVVDVAEAPAAEPKERANGPPDGGVSEFARSEVADVPEAPAAAHKERADGPERASDKVEVVKEAPAEQMRFGHGARQVFSLQSEDEEMVEEDEVDAEDAMWEAAVRDVGGATQSGTDFGVQENLAKEAVPDYASLLEELETRDENVSESLPPAATVRTAAGPSLPDAGTTVCAPLAFEGQWTTTDSEEAASIQRNVVQMADGASMCILRVTPNEIVCDWFGEHVSARLSDDGSRLIWSDGDEWVRVLKRREATEETLVGKPTVIAPSGLRMSPSRGSEAAGVAATSSATRPTTEPSAAKNGGAQLVKDASKEEAASSGHRPPSPDDRARRAPAAAPSAKERGSEALEAGRWEEAAAAFEAATKLDPHDGIAHGLLQVAKMQAWAVRGIPVFCLELLSDAEALAKHFERPGAEAKARGAAACRSGRLEEAVEQLTAAQRWNLADEVAERMLQSAKLRLWASQGIPVLRLGAFEDAERLAEQYASASRMSMPELMSWYRTTGLPEESDMSQSEIVRLLKAVNLWKALPMSELREECRRRGLPARAAGNPGSDLTAERQRKVKELLLEERMAAWEAKGYQARRIGDVCDVIQLVEAIERAANMDMNSLKAWYTGLGFPPQESVEKTELVDLMKTVAIWDALPVEELEKECIERGVETDQAYRPKSVVEQRDALVMKLLIARRMAAWEANGIPAKRIGDPDIVASVAAEFSRISALDRESLLKWYTSCGFPAERGLTDRELADLSKMATIWSVLSFPDLLRECEERGVQCAEVTDALAGKDVATIGAKEQESIRTALVDRLLLDNRVRAWDARGLCASKFSDINMALQVVEQHENIDTLDLAELQAWYKGLSLPYEEGMCRDELVELAQKVMLWDALPLKHLRAECEAKGASLSAVAGEEDEQRVVFMNLLLMHERMPWWDKRGFEASRIGDPQAVFTAVDNYERFRAMELEELRAKCSQAAIPPPILDPDADEEAEREVLLRGIKMVLTWEVLPLDELKRECEERGLSWEMRRSALSINRGSHRDDLVDRLKGNLQLKSKPADVGVRRTTSATSSDAPTMPEASLGRDGVDGAAAAGEGIFKPISPLDRAQAAGSARGVNDSPLPLGRQFRAAPTITAAGAFSAVNASSQPSAAAREPSSPSTVSVESVPRDDDAKDGDADGIECADPNQPPDLMDWYAVGGGMSNESALLLARLSNVLRGDENQIELALADVPNPESHEYVELLQELGFTAMERMKLRKLLRERRAQASTPLGASLPGG